jgi:molecular chaperone DnaK
MQTLSEASATLAQKMYADQAEAGAGDAGADDDLGDAVDAEFEEVKDDKG